MPAAPNPPEPRAAARARAALARDRAAALVGDTLGDLMAFWNFKPSMGKVWAALYLSREPLDADEIGRRTGLSAGSVSMTLQELIHWGVVRRAWVAGSRRRLFEAETDIVSLVTHVFRERELRVVTEAVARFEEALRILDEEAGSSRPDELLEGRFLATRVENLLSLARVGRRVVEQLARVGSVDLAALRGALRRGGKEGSG